MRYVLGSAFRLAIALSLVAGTLIITACPGMPGTHRSLPQESAADPERIPPEDERFPARRDPAVTVEPPDLSLQELAERFEAILPVGFSLVRREEDEPALLRAPRGGVFGLARSPEALYVASVLAEPGGEPRLLGDSTPLLQEAGPDCSVEEVRPYRFSVSAATAGEHDGFEAVLICDRAEWSLFVLLRSSAEDRTDRDDPEPFHLLEPLSAVTRTVLRDLTGDGVPELVRYSRVFNSDGRRELILEAFRWTQPDLKLLGSTAIVQRVDLRLNVLEQSLVAPLSPDIVARIGEALVPLEESPPASDLLPAEEVRLPRFTIPPLRLGAPGWEFDRELALGPHLYRFRLVLEANPLIDDPVRIEGLDRSAQRFSEN